MNKSLGIFLFLYATISFSQKEDYHWFGGIETNISGGINGYTFDFNEKNATPNYIDLSLGFTDNNASISDKEGNLLFYFNGCAVFNKEKEVMPNGDSINSGVWFDKFWKDCRYGYPGFQDVLILNDPKNEDGYYLFHKPNIYYPLAQDSFQLHYSYIDMSLAGGKGDVVVKNKKYYERENLTYAYFSGIRHENQEDWWLIQPTKYHSIFLTFLLSEKGIERKANQNSQEYFNDYTSAGGTAKFSPDGTKYALYSYTNQLHIYDFDRETGFLSNHKKIEIYDPDSIDYDNFYFSSVEWSPNSRFIYCASYLKLHQVDTWENNIQDGVRHIDDYNGTLDPFPNELFLMAQAPDCKIYMTPKNGSYSIHVINKPNEPGKACDFVQNGIKLPAQNSGTLPNFPRFRVDEEDKCDPTITSIFGESVYFRRKLDIFPSPSTGTYQVRMPDEANDGFLMVTDIQGKVILKLEINNFQHIREIDISDQPSGRYNIEYYPNMNPERIFYGRQVVKI